MMDLEYEDFDVEVVVPEQGKPLVLVKCQQGTGKEEVDLSPQLFTQDVSAIAATVTRSSKSRGRLDEAQLRPEEFERLGRNLFHRLLPRTLAELYSLTRGAAGERHKGTRIRLTIEDPAIARLPWELLNSSRDNFLCLAKETPVIRNPSVPRPVAPLEAQLPLRVLAVMSNSATEPLDLEEEKHRVEQAFSRLREGNQLRLVWFERGTLDALSNQLEEFDPHILHFAGHGEFNERSSEGQITLQDDRGNPVPLAAADLALLLKGVPSLRLVFLNSCEGAREGSKALSSTASQLIAAGVPAVIAMQFEISDDVAIAFAEKVYWHLCKNRPIDYAVTRARIGIKVNQSFEWSTPVLYLRAREAVLFHFDKKDTEPPLPPPPKGRFQKLVKFLASHPLILSLLGAGFLALIVIVGAALLHRPDPPPPPPPPASTSPSTSVARAASAASGANLPPGPERHAEAAPQGTTQERKACRDCDQTRDPRKCLSCGMQLADQDHKYEEAIKYYDNGVASALRKKDRLHDALAELSASSAIASFNLGRYDDAKELAERALKQEICTDGKSDCRSAALAKKVFGFVAAKSGDRAKAENYYQEGLEKCPRSCHGPRHAIETLKLIQGDPSKALLAAVEIALSGQALTDDLIGGLSPGEQTILAAAPRARHGLRIFDDPSIASFYYSRNSPLKPPLASEIPDASEATLGDQDKKNEKMVTDSIARLDREFAAVTDAGQE